MMEAKKKASIDSQLDEIEKIIQEYEYQKKSLLIERSALLTLSAEFLTRSAITDFIIHLSFFKNKDLTEPCFSLEDVEYLSQEELSEFLFTNNLYLNKFSHESLRRISVQPIVRQFIKSSNGAESFFGKNGKDLSMNQVLLFDYSKYFSSLLEKIENISQDEKTDPDEIERIFILESNKDKNKETSRSSLMQVFQKTEQ